MARMAGYRAKSRPMPTMAATLAAAVRAASTLVMPVKYRTPKETTSTPPTMDSPMTLRTPPFQPSHGQTQKMSTRSAMNGRQTRL